MLPHALLGLPLSASGVMRGAFVGVGASALRAPEFAGLSPSPAPHVDADGRAGTGEWELADVTWDETALAR